MRWPMRWLAALGLVATAAGAGLAVARSRDTFDHVKHARLFPTCVTCHLGAAQADAPFWPTREGCESCHDGRLQPFVDWTPPLGREGHAGTNLRFTHSDHQRLARDRNPADSALGANCSACHTESGAPRMTVQHAVVGSCLDCHQVTGTHLAVADSACGSCHYALADARTLSRERVAAFPSPPSHQDGDFTMAGHGRLAVVPGHPEAVAQSCATCHAREFCIACHVNAPEVPAIQALALDERSTALAVSLPVPASHAGATFERAHGADARRKGATCAACHTQESCSTCHLGQPPGRTAQLPTAGPGRGPGAQLAREAPATHTSKFRDGHGPEASARPQACQTCHVRETCLTCHIPNAAGSGSYHPDGYLTRHPSSAYNRDANCSDCHNPAQFCQTCHKQSGLVSGVRGLGGKGYHDAQPNFIVGHGQAARLNLESCVSCHVERDCTRCHSSRGIGYGFNPHGPNWRPETVKKKNPSLCIACHGTVPGK